MKLEYPGILKNWQPQSLLVNEQADFQRACEILTAHARLQQSLQRQERARKLMRLWRIIHITIAYIALIAISYHAIMQLLSSVFHIL
ncbi:MAG: hypothetical protein NVS4B11_26740 [Ktedonobacteraceae bacterium]